MLQSEWGEAPPDGAVPSVVRIGFLGHASRDKGFALFAELARTARGPAREFHAIGLAAPEAHALDLGGLARKPSRAAVPRDEYVAALAGIDLACLPLSPDYQYVASGSVIDAIAALKPLACVRNRSLDAIVARYGPIDLFMHRYRRKSR